MDAPLHERVASDLRRRISSGELPVGSAIPSESHLCEQWGISRGPIRQALATLRAEGLIGGGRGKPPVVRSQSMPQPFETFLSFSRWVELMGRTPGQRTLEIARRPATPEACDALGLEEGEPVVQMLRLRLMDGLPAMVERTTFVWSAGRLLFDFDCDSGSVFAHLSRCGVDLSRARHVIDAVAADDADAGLLGVPRGAPCCASAARPPPPPASPSSSPTTATAPTSSRSPSTTRSRPTRRCCAAPTACFPP
ncbi:GntR family transcriptional regulator [Nonomuraea rubra]|uniref:GntR family transcriptional regulator n=1 Tax=Nonomuraea rubra TaxID=46180 RepID=UPI003607B8ED